MSDAVSARIPGAVPRGKHQILTPEGVLLTFDLADAGERAAAFLIDAFFIILIITLLLIGMFLIFFLGALAAIGSGWVVALLIIGFFLVRTFYFPFFELRWRGSTPGKRAMKLRVIDRDGGPLRPDSIMVRNLMREVEIFLPLTALLGVSAADGAQRWMILLMLVWTGLFTLFPLFNRDRLRLGDLVAGTCVISAPRAILLRDLVEPAQVKYAAAAEKHSPERQQFTQRQLDVYGVMELQALEDALRRTDIHARETLTEIARRIRKRIDWQDDPSGTARSNDDRAFLEDFYAAQRGHLEHDMLFGVHRKDKNDRQDARGAAKDR